MRKSINNKNRSWLIRLWALRLFLGAGLSYGLSLCIMALFHHFGDASTLIIGFLCVFALMPAFVLITLSLPSRQQQKPSSGRSIMLSVAALPLLWMSLATSPLFPGL